MLGVKEFNSHYVHWVFSAKIHLKVGKNERQISLMFYMHWWHGRKINTNMYKLATNVSPCLLLIFSLSLSPSASPSPSPSPFLFVEACHWVAVEPISSDSDHWRGFVRILWSMHVGENSCDQQFWGVLSNKHLGCSSFWSLWAARWDQLHSATMCWLYWRHSYSLLKASVTFIIAATWAFYKLLEKPFCPHWPCEPVVIHI